MSKLKEKVREEETRALLPFLLKRQCGILGGMQVLGTRLILFFHFNYLFDNYFPFLNHRFFCICSIACSFPQAYIVFPQSPHLLQFFSAFIITLLMFLWVDWLCWAVFLLYNVSACAAVGRVLDDVGGRGWLSQVYGSWC